MLCCFTHITYDLFFTNVPSYYLCLLKLWYFLFYRNEYLKRCSSCKIARYCTTRCQVCYMCLSIFINFSPWCNNADELMCINLVGIFFFLLHKCTVVGQFMYRNIFLLVWKVQRKITNIFRKKIWYNILQQGSCRKTAVTISKCTSSIWKIASNFGLKISKLKEVLLQILSSYWIVQMLDISITLVFPAVMLEDFNSSVPSFRLTITGRKKDRLLQIQLYSKILFKFSWFFICQ